ncbi:hypothetical protein OG943_10790 [Amycolatopsis sp. NBC_00345]|uniref:hypothetical protein n=1 Tax=Amycolatopsis sp. NBC_00345 TaxID=2975955 RepID=UPI002E270624
MDRDAINESEHHEDAALDAIEHNKNSEAQVHATLAVSKAINQLINTIDPERTES